MKKALRPIIKVIQAKYKRRQKLIKGKDEKRLIFNLNLIEKLKNKRKKINLKHGSTNMEKIRLLYVKLILILTEKNNEIKYSSTPKEIKKDLH